MVCFSLQFINCKTFIHPHKLSLSFAVKIILSQALNDAAFFDKFNHVSCPIQFTKPKIVPQTLLSHYSLPPYFYSCTKTPPGSGYCYSIYTCDTLTKGTRKSRKGN